MFRACFSDEKGIMADQREDGLVKFSFTNVGFFARHGYIRHLAKCALSTIENAMEQATSFSMARQF